MPGTKLKFIPLTSKDLGLESDSEIDSPKEMQLDNSTSVEPSLAQAFLDGGRKMCVEVTLTRREVLNKASYERVLSPEISV